MMGFLAVFGTGGGYYAGSYVEKKRNEPVLAVLYNQRDAEALQNLKIVKALRENQVREATVFLEMLLRNSLKSEGISESTTEAAKDYQRKYCGSPCLDIED